MSRYHSYLRTAVDILDAYHHEEPFSAFLKKYFSSYRKFGSKDRKIIAHLCYSYFRLGKAVMHLNKEERILQGLFLCSGGPNEMLDALKPEWNEKTGLPFGEKILILDSRFSVQDVFPWKNELSAGIDHEKFCTSFFKQPDLFLRVRPGKEENVKQQLDAAGINYRTLAESCIALPNASKIDSVVELDENAIIQDYSSQFVGRFIRSAFASLQDDKLSVWDCCAGSGGKSILPFDINPGIELTVSDTRKSILANLEKRFYAAGIRNYKSHIIDLTSNKIREAGIYDLIIADVPCTGSGTWSRTPESLFYFDENLPAGGAGNIEKYASLQMQILSNVIPHLKKNGYLLYITCSVFRKENEAIVDFISSGLQLNVNSMEIIKGYDKRADTMFSALLSA